MELPFAFAQQVTGPVSGKVEWAIPIGAHNKMRKDSLSIKDAVSFWETFQFLGDYGKSNAKCVAGPLSQAATFEQILANWEFRGKPGRNSTLEDVVQYAVNRWRRHPRTVRKKTKRYARSSGCPYPSREALEERTRRRKSHREKNNRRKVNEKFDNLCELVKLDPTAKMEKSLLLSETIRLIENLKIENQKLERERKELFLQCQSVSRCLSAGLSQLQRVKQTASAAAAAAVKRSSRPPFPQEGCVFQTPRNRRENEWEKKAPTQISWECVPPVPAVPQVPKMPADWGSVPPPPKLPLPKVQFRQEKQRQRVRKTRRQSDALLQHILSQRRSLDEKKNTDSFFAEFYREPEAKSENGLAPMTDVDYTFKPVFDEVLSELPKPDYSSDSLLRPSNFI